MTFMPVLFAVSKQLDGLSCLHHQVADMIHKGFFFTESKDSLRRQHQYVPIRIGTGIAARTRAIQPHFGFRLYFMHILLNPLQHLLVNGFRHLSFLFHFLRTMFCLCKDNHFSINTVLFHPKMKARDAVCQPPLPQPTNATTVA